MSYNSPKKFYCILDKADKSWYKEDAAGHFFSDFECCTIFVEKHTAVTIINKLSLTDCSIMEFSINKWCCQELKLD